MPGAAVPEDSKKVVRFSQFILLNLLKAPDRAAKEEQTMRGNTGDRPEKRSEKTKIR